LKEKNMALWYIFVFSIFVGAAGYAVSCLNEQWDVLILLIGILLAGVPPIIKREDKVFNFQMGIFAGMLGVLVAFLIDSNLL